MWDYICGINSTSDRQMLKVNGMLTQYNGAVVHCIYGGIKLIAMVGKSLADSYNPASS